MFQCFSWLPKLVIRRFFTEYESELPVSNLAICASNIAPATATIRKSSRNFGSYKTQNGFKANGLNNVKKGSHLYSGTLPSRRDNVSVNDDDDASSLCMLCLKFYLLSFFLLNLCKSCLVVCLFWRKHFLLNRVWNAFGKIHPDSIYPLR